MSSVTAAAVKAQARVLGFDLCGIAPAGDLPELGFYQEWLARGYAGEMAYLHRTADRRADVRSILPSARSVIVLGTLYDVDRPYTTQADAPGRAAIARYAWGEDYHAVIESRLGDLLEWLGAAAGAGFDGKAYVDTGPVQERVYARHAGLGWIGKNTCVINEERGSWIFLSEIICNLTLAPDAPATDQCGNCTLCLSACPTGAIVEPYVLDAARCLSYLTIELKGSIPDEQREALGAHAYGCDICQEVCPWNLSPTPAADPVSPWLPRAAFDGVSLLELWRRSDAELREAMKGSAMKRAGLTRLRRNLAVALGNSHEAGAAEALEACTEPSIDDPVVLEHVAWAIGRLSVET